MNFSCKYAFELIVILHAHAVYTFSEIHFQSVVSVLVLGGTLGLRSVKSVCSNLLLILCHKWVMTHETTPQELKKEKPAYTFPDLTSFSF